MSEHVLLTFYNAKTGFKQDSTLVQDYIHQCNSQGYVWLAWWHKTGEAFDEATIERLRSIANDEGLPCLLLHQGRPKIAFAAHCIDVLFQLLPAQVCVSQSHNDAFCAYSGKYRVWFKLDYVNPSPLTPVELSTYEHRKLDTLHHVEKHRNDFEKTLVISTTTRSELRQKIVSEFLAETPGTSICTNHYRYYVETLSDGTRLFLDRPGILNNGIDFVIYCENHLPNHKGNVRPPKHKDLTEELRNLCTTSQAHSAEIKQALLAIWECELPQTVFAATHLFRNNIMAERTLLIARWMFIEQDLTYWNGSGRFMLRSAIEQHIGHLPG